MTASVNNSNQTHVWQHADSKHHLHPFTTHPELRSTGPRVITHADGVYIYDSEGEKILDGMAGLWCVQVGYGNHALVRAATQAMDTLPYYNTFFQTTHPYVAELSEAIASLTPDGLDTMVFANSGSEANDSGVKLIRYYWNLKKKPNKKIILTRELAYHGVTLASASMAGLETMHPQFDLPLPGFQHVYPAPYWFGRGYTLEPKAFSDLCVQALEDKILELGPENVAAFCGEPVMGAGGMITPPPDYWPRIEAICRKHDVLLWSDEVICGFGRTGKWFGCQTYSFNPDIMTVAKGMSSGYQPISATILGGDIAATIANSDQEMAHGFTYSGHPVACAVAQENIRQMQALELVDSEHAATRSSHLQRGLANLADHPLVGETRGVGFLGAVELVSDKASGTRFHKDLKAGQICRNHCIDAGIIVRAVGDTMVMSPPLIIEEPEIDQLIDKIQESLDRTAQSLGRRV